jgi:hypothetical protein
MIPDPQDTSKIRVKPDNESVTESPGESHHLQSLAMACNESPGGDVLE